MLKKFTLFFSFLILFTFVFIGKSHASELEFPEIPSNNYNYSEYFIVKNGKYSSGSDKIYLNVFYSNNPISDIRFSVDTSGVVRFDNFSSNSFSYYQYLFEDNSWVRTASNLTIDSGAYHTFRHNGTLPDILVGTSNIYRSVTNDEIFFLVPPTPTTPTVEEMVAEEVPKMAEKVIQTMKIILLCGVGCLALLISLPVLLKVFYRFRLK